MKASMKIFRSASWPRSNAAQKETPAHSDAAPEPSSNRIHRSVLKGLSKIVSASQALVPRRSKSLEATPSRPEGRGARLNRVSSEASPRPGVAELRGSPLSELDGTPVQPLPTIVVTPPPEEVLPPAGSIRRQAIELDRTQVRPSVWSDKIALADEPPDGLMSDGSAPTRVQTVAPRQPAVVALRDTGVWSDKIVVGPEDGRDAAPLRPATSRQPLFRMPSGPCDGAGRPAFAEDVPPPVPDKVLEQLPVPTPVPVPDNILKGPPLPPKEPLPEPVAEAAVPPAPLRRATPRPPEGLPPAQGESALVLSAESARLPVAEPTPARQKVRHRPSTPKVPRLPTYAEALVSGPVDRLAVERMTKLLIDHLEASGLQVPRSRRPTPPASPVAGQTPPPYAPEYSAAAIRIMASVAELLLRQLAANPALAARWSMPLPRETPAAEAPGLPTVSGPVDPVA